MKATFEEGTDLVIDSETIALKPTWAEEPSSGCDLQRNGRLVTLSLRIKNANAKAWSKKKYKEKELAVEGGNIYEAAGAGLSSKETDENKPSTKPTQWKKLGSQALIATLPADYVPAVNLLDTTGKVEVKTNGEVVSTRSEAELETQATNRYEIAYRAGNIA